MKSIETPRSTVNSRATLLSRFRFHGIEGLLAEQLQRRDMSKTDQDYRGKIRFRGRFETTTVSCPRCDAEAMTVYRRRLGDEWACCDSCGYGNDVPGIVAEVLHIPVRQAVEFLVYQHGLRGIGNDEIERYLQYRSRYDQFTARLNERLSHSYAPCNSRANHGLDVVELERLLDRLDLLQYADVDINIEFSMTGKDGYRNRPVVRMERDIPSSWRSPLNYPSDFFAVEDHRLVETWWSDNYRYDNIKRRFFGNTSPSRLFHGKGWGQVLVIPLQDVPGHSSGALYIGREGRYPDDYKIKLLPDLDGKPTSSGYFMPFRNYRAIARSVKREESMILATTNVLHAVRTMLKARGPHPTPPLLGWIDEIEGAPEIKTTDWSPFRSVANKTFWLQRFDPIPMRTIIEQDAHVVEYDMMTPYPDTVREPSFCGHPGFRPNIFALGQMLQDGVPWQKYLADHLRTLSTESAVATLQTIAVTSERYAAILGQLPVSKKVDTLRDARQTIAGKTAWIGRYEVFLEPAGLFRKTLRQKHATLASDAVCHLDTVFNDPRRRKKIYRGRILYDGREISFDLPASTFDRRPMDSVRNVVLKAGLSEPIFRCKDRFYRNAVLAFSRLKGKSPHRQS